MQLAHMHLVVMLCTSNLGLQLAGSSNHVDFDDFDEDCTDSDLQWDKFTGSCQTHLESVGWFKERWDGDFDLHECEDLKNFDDIDGNCIESDLHWDDLTPHCRSYHKGKGWFKECWDCDCSDHDLLDWDELSPEVRREMTTLNWTQEDWDHKDPCSLRHTQSRPELFNPLVLEIHVSEVMKMNSDYLGSIDYEMRLVDGSYNKLDNMVFLGETMKMKEFVERAKGDDEKLRHVNLHLEGMIREKVALKGVGNNVVEYMRNALSKNSEALASGNWKPKYDALDDDNFDWAMFMGVKGTVTHMHLDTDFMQFLYVVQGKKRVVVIPNDERTAKTYKPRQGQWSMWTDVDILDKTEPLPKYAQEFILTPGKGLFIPYLAWHAVENVEFSIGYNLRIIE